MSTLYTFLIHLHVAISILNLALIAWMFRGALNNFLKNKKQALILLIVLFAVSITPVINVAVLIGCFIALVIGGMLKEDRRNREQVSDAEPDLPRF